MDGVSRPAFPTAPVSSVTVSPNPFWGVCDSCCLEASVFLGYRRQAILGREVLGKQKEKAQQATEVTRAQGKGVSFEG